MKQETEHRNQPEAPLCYFCKRREWAEGDLVTSPYSGETVFVCFECSSIIHEFFNAFAADLIETMQVENRLKVWNPKEDKQNE